MKTDDSDDDDNDVGNVILTKMALFLKGLNADVNDGVGGDERGC